jgi:alkanesulfonate monooxygenase SsuD/methylene tetrahydromethanopterin reductase-like flavin-dependent oxidoreductase (luciferase family)
LPEYTAAGLAFEPHGVRFKRMAESLQILKGLFSDDPLTFDGTHFQISEMNGLPKPLQKPHPPIMIGGSGKKLLQIAGAEAQIANLIPPIINGKDFVQDPAAAIRFDKADVKRRIAMLRGFAKDAGRDPDAIEISGIVMLSIARSKSEVDAAIKATAAGMGFPSADAARNSPVLLMGTPDEVKRELRSRIEDFGMTYYIVFPTTPETRDLLVKDIMPEFNAH